MGRQRHRRHAYIQVQPAGNAAAGTVTAAAPAAGLGEAAASPVASDTTQTLAASTSRPQPPPDLLEQADRLGAALADAEGHGRGGEADRVRRRFLRLLEQHPAADHAALQDAYQAGQDQRARQLDDELARRTAATDAERRRRQLADKAARGAFMLRHRVELDTTPCGTCDGTGQRRLRRGQERCAHCDGAGRRLTPQARRADRQIDSLIHRTLRAAAYEVQVGDRLLVPGGDGDRYPAEVTAIDRDSPYSLHGPIRFHLAAHQGSTAFRHLDQDADLFVLRAPTPEQDAAMLATIARYRGCTVRDLDLGPAPADVAAGEGADG